MFFPPFQQFSCSFSGLFPLFGLHSRHSVLLSDLCSSLRCGHIKNVPYSTSCKCKGRSSRGSTLIADVLSRTSTSFFVMITESPCLIGASPRWFSTGSGSGHFQRRFRGCPSLFTFPVYSSLQRFVPDYTREVSYCKANFPFGANGNGSLRFPVQMGTVLSDSRCQWGRFSTAPPPALM